MPPWRTIRRKSCPRPRAKGRKEGEGPLAGIKEIRTRIKSVEQTLKITNAMYLISSANLRKAKGRLDNTVPLFYQDI